MAEEKSDLVIDFISCTEFQVRSEVSGQILFEGSISDCDAFIRTFDSGVLKFNKR